MSVKFAIALLALFLTGCGSCQRTLTGLTGGLTEKCARTGIVYVQSDSGLAVLLDQAGKPVGCVP